MVQPACTARPSLSAQDATLAQTLGQLQPSLAVFRQECTGQTWIFWANLTPFSPKCLVRPRTKTLASRAELGGSSRVTTSWYDEPWAVKSLSDNVLIQTRSRMHTIAAVF
jgi:hypothetical protein